ncbi:MAG: TonB-dependent receptor, partial [Bacteroidota bacterium]
MRLLALLVALLASGPAWAQVSVTGTVTDSSGTGLPGATVVLLNPADSVLVSFASSRSDGAFEVRRVREADYILKVSFVGYATHTQDIRVARDDLDVGRITMQEADGDLGRLVVDAERVPIVLRGDTLDYDAGAFATPDGAVVEDLLRRLPGVEVEEDGSVTAQGERVENVLVDGKEFFGDDPTVATRNLPADAVDRVQVYDKASDTAEFTGVDDGEDERTINLQLKEDRRSGYFGNIGGGLGGVPTPEASGGSGLLYDTQASVNRFSPTTQLSLIANINNINRQSFSIGDYFQFMGGMGSVGRGGIVVLGAGGIPVGGQDEGGFSETLSVGLNANHEFNAKTSLQSSYFLHSLDKTTTRFTRREQFFGDDLSSLLQEDADGNDQTLVHRLTLGGSHDFADDHDLRLRSSLVFGTNDVVSLQDQQTLGPRGLLQNASASDLRSDGRNLNGEASLTYRRKFAGNRSIVARVGGEVGDQDGDADFFAITRLFDEGNLLTTDEISQLQSQRNASLTGEGSVLFTQPIGRRQALQLRVAHRETAEDQTREVFDDIDGALVLNDEQSSAFERIYRYDTAGLTYRKNGDTVELSAGIEGQLTRLGGTQAGASGEVDTQFLRALPSARLTLALAQSRNLELRYETRTREPSVRELQPVVD